MTYQLLQNLYHNISCKGQYAKQVFKARDQIIQAEIEEKGYPRLNFQMFCHLPETSKTKNDQSKN